jgi:hypothetical protein
MVKDVKVVVEAYQGALEQVGVLKRDQKSLMV